MHYIDLQTQQFHELYVKNRQKLLRFAYSYLKDEMLAEDIVMDSFMHYWEHRETIEKDVSPLPYILATIKNRCLNQLQKLRVRQRAQSEIHAVNARILALQISSLTACDPNELFSREAKRIIGKAISELPKQTREVFIRGRIQDQPYKQIIAEMHITLGVVDYEIRKAKKILAGKIKSYYPDILLILIFLFIY